MSRHHLSSALARIALARLRGELSVSRAARLTRALILEDHEDADDNLSPLRRDHDDAGRAPIDPSGHEANHD